MSSGEAGGGRAGRNALGVLISVVSLVGVAWWGARQERPVFPDDARDFAPILLVLGSYVFLTLARGKRWHTILARAGVPHDPTDAYALIPVGYMGNNVLPARGGEILRVVLMGERSGARKREVLGSIVAERLLDVAALIGLFTLVTLLGVAGTPVGNRPLVVVAAVVVAAGALLAAYRAIRRRGRFGRFAAAIQPFVGASRLLVGRLGLALMALTSVIWLGECVNFWLVGQSLDLEISLLEAAFLVALTSFVVAVPSGPGYVGTFEAALVFGLDALGVPGGQALAYTLLVRFVVFVPITLAGLALVFARYGGLTRLFGRARPRAAS